MPWREEVVRLLQILGLSGFAFAQPILDVFGRSPETFVFRGAGRTEIVIFAAVIALVPGLLAWTLGVPSGLLGPRARRGVHAGTLGVLASVVGIQVLKSATSLLGLPLVALGAAFGVIVVLLFVRWPTARQWFTYASPAPLAFVAIFLLVSPVSKLILPAPGRTVGDIALADRVPLIMVVFDELPLVSLLDGAGEINDELFPNYARLAGMSTWYRNYTVTENRSHFSLPTILSGRLMEDRSKYPVSADFPNTVFSALRATHRVTAQEWYTALCPSHVCAEARASVPESPLAGLVGDAAGIWGDLSLPRAVTRDIMEQFGLDAGATAAAPPPDPRRGDDQPQGAAKLRLGQFDAFLRSLHPSRRPPFSFMHANPPHSPWILFPSGMRYENIRRHTVPDARPTRWIDEDWPVRVTRSRHLLQVGFTDDMVGALLRRLERTGLLHEALLVVTSDHGISFTPGGPLRSFSAANLHEVASVPLFVKAPGQRSGLVDDRNLSAPDLLPTIADMLGFEVPWRTDGASALDPETDRGPVKRITRHHDPPKFPQPDRTFSIEVETLERRLLRDAFTPADPSADPSLWPHLLGPGAHLVGGRVADLEIGPPAAARATLQSPRGFENVDLSSGTVTALVSGLVEGSSRNARVAVTLNGRIAGVSPMFSAYGSDTAFEVLIPEAYFRQGRNNLRLFLLQGTVLRRIHIA